MEQKVLHIYCGWRKAGFMETFMMTGLLDLLVGRWSNSNLMIPVILIVPS